MRCIHIVLLVCLLWGSGSLQAIADDLTPEDYVRVDVAARQATLDGMEKRLLMLQKKVDSRAQAAAEEASHQNVEVVFKRYATTGAAHAAYGTRNQKAVDQWLREHPDWQIMYKDLSQRFETLSRQLEAAQQGN